MSGIDLDLDFVAQRLVEDAVDDELATIVVPVTEIIRVAMARTPTGMAPVRENTVDDLRALIDDAEEFHNGAELTNVTRHDALRIFLAPEWYFRRSNAPYTHADMRGTIEQLKTLSSLYPRWLILPGTIFFGLGYDTSGGAPDLATLQQEIVDCTRLTLNDANPDAYAIRNEPLNPDTWFCINLAPVFYQGTLIHYVCKRYEQDLYQFRKDVDFWAMSVLPSATRAQVTRSSFFTLQNVVGNTPLRFALDICRDHRMLRALQSHAATQAGDAGVDIHIVIANQVDVEAQQTCTHDCGLVLHCDGHVPITAVHHTARNIPPCRDAALMAEAQRLAEVGEGLFARSWQLEPARRDTANRLQQLQTDLHNERQTCSDLRQRISDAELEATLLSARLGWVENADLPTWKSDLEFHSARVRMWEQALPDRRREAETARAASDDVDNRMNLVQQATRAIDTQITDASAAGLAQDGTNVDGQYVRWRGIFEFHDITDPGVVGPAPPNAVVAPAPTPTYRCQSCTTPHQPFFANVCTNCGRSWFRDRKIMFYRSA